MLVGDLLRSALLMSVFSVSLPHFPAVQAQTTPPSRQEREDQKGEEEKKNEEESIEEEETNAGNLAEVEPAAGPLAAIGGVPLLLGGGVAVVGGVAAAGGGGSDSSAPAGGGGGGDGDDGGGGGDESPSNVSDPPALTDDEVAATVGLPIINAQSAYERGYTGDGVTIGVVDSGIFQGHVEFGSKLIDCYKADTAVTGCDRVEVDFHGTHVAGIAAARKNDIGMHGVAYDADIYHADIFVHEVSNETVSGVSFAKQAASFDWLISKGVQVANNSYGVLGTHEDYSLSTIQNTFNSTTPIGRAYRGAVNNGIIMVWAAGNSEESEPDLLSALPVYYPELEELWVAVTAVSTNGGTLASYSNACGQAAAFCISAPGGQFRGSNADGGILSAYTTNFHYAYATGTSMAAPHVTGGVAILLEAFGPGTPSNLSPEEIVDLMFATADKSGIYANSTVYGQGLLDLDAATQPHAPTLALATNGSFGQNNPLVNNTNIVFGPAFGNASDNALAGLRAGAHDKYGRIFTVDLAALTSPATAVLDSKKLLMNFGTGEVHTMDLNGKGKLEFSFNHNPYEAAFNQSGTQHSLGSSEQTPPIEKLSFQSEITPVTRVSFHYGINPGQKFGLQAEGNLNQTILAADDQSLNPYLDFAGDDGISTGFTLKKKAIKITSLSFMSLEEKEDRLYGAHDSYDQVMGSAVDASYDVNDKISVSAIAGSMQENENILGMESSGAFNMESDTYTFFGGANVGFTLSENIRLMGGWQLGWTEAGAISDSLFSDFSTIETDSFTVGITGENSFKEDDEWGVIIHQPVRVRKAQATARLPVARSDQGAVLYSEQNIDLEPNGHELSFQAFYSAPLEHNQDFSAGVVYRMQPGHDRNADPDTIGLVRYRFKF